MKLKRELVKLRVREDRPNYIGKRFAAYLTGKVLDVGCDQAVLRKIVGPDRYKGIGMTEESDVKLNLEQADQLPFRNGEWDTVLCLDTLEHLNNLHAFARDLFRIAREHIIISLPNCWSVARRALAKGRGSIWHYGLPLTTPPDRHKWFFNTEDAYSFLEAQEGRSDFPVKILEMVALEHKRPLVNRAWRHIKHPAPTHYLNLYVNTVVCVYKRTNGI